MKSLSRPLLLTGLALSFAATQPVHAGPDLRQSLFRKTVAFYNDTVQMHFVSNRQLFSEGWDTLAQTRFWRQVIAHSPDSMIINEASSRRILSCIPAEEWVCQEEGEKDDYRDYIRRTHGLDSGSSLFVTMGKRDFYEYKKVIPFISRSIDVFMDEGVDPWYAQTILLIESPGKSAQKSSAGAYGPFQLMRGVARKFGLVVNRYSDERADLLKAARASSRLLGTICIPKTKEMLDSLGIPYNETDLWFRLLVMHAYHAGAGNVRCMLEMLQPVRGGQALFRDLWTNECRGFRNESQNYSQIALASLVHFESLVGETPDTAFLVTGDALMAQYRHGNPSGRAALPWLTDCLMAYENDLVDGVIPFEYFYRRVDHVNREIDRLSENLPASHPAPSPDPLGSERFVRIGDQLLRKKNVDEAIKVYKLNIEKNPMSPMAYDSLGRAYRLIGKNDLAVKYINKSAELKGSLRP